MAWLRVVSDWHRSRTLLSGKVRRARCSARHSADRLHQQLLRTLRQRRQYIGLRGRQVRVIDTGSQT